MTVQAMGTIDCSDTARGSAGRLKHVRVDDLEKFGLPSKSDTRLLDAHTQEDYYRSIVHRCLHLGLTTSDQHDLGLAFTSLSIAHGQLANWDSQQMAQAEQAALERIVQLNSDHAHQLSVILMAMRKLREAIVAAGRLDAFFFQVYRFIIRFTILARHADSYHPALLYILSRVHSPPSLPSLPSLQSRQLHEFVGYYVVDLACRQGDLATAYQMKHRFRLRNREIDMILKAVIRGDWYLFGELQGQLDMYHRRLVGFGEPTIRSHAIKCIGQSYLAVDKVYIEQVTNQTWEQVKKESGVAWTLEGDLVIIRRIKKK